MTIEIREIEEALYKEIEDGNIDEVIEECKQRLGEMGWEESTFVYPLLAQAYFKQGDYENSTYYMRVGLELAKTQQNKRVEAQIYTMHARWDVVLEKDLEQTIINQRKAVKLSEELDDHVFLLRNYNNLGVLYIQQGKYEQAFEYLEKVLKVPLDMNNHMEKMMFAVIRNNVGRIYYKQGRVEDAKRIFQEAIDKEEDSVIRRSVVPIYCNLAEIYQDNKEYEKCIAYLNKALELYMEIGNKVDEVGIYKQLSSVYEEMGDYKQAFMFYKCYADLKDIVKR